MEIRHIDDIGDGDIELIVQRTDPMEAVARNQREVISGLYPSVV